MLMLRSVNEVWDEMKEEFDDESKKLRDLLFYWISRREGVGFKWFFFEGILKNKELIKGNLRNKKLID